MAEKGRFGGPSGDYGGGRQASGDSALQAQKAASRQTAVDRIAQEARVAQSRESIATGAGVHIGETGFTTGYMKAYDKWTDAQKERFKEYEEQKLSYKTIADAENQYIKDNLTSILNDQDLANVISDQQSKLSTNLSSQEALTDQLVGYGKHVLDGFLNSTIENYKTLDVVSSFADETWGDMKLYNESPAFRNKVNQKAAGLIVDAVEEAKTASENLFNKAVVKGKNAWNMMFGDGSSEGQLFDNETASGLNALSSLTVESATGKTWSPMYTTKGLTETGADFAAKYVANTTSNDQITANYFNDPANRPQDIPPGITVPRVEDLPIPPGITRPRVGDPESNTEKLLGDVKEVLGGGMFKAIPQYLDYYKNTPFFGPVTDEVRQSWGGERIGGRPEPGMAGRADDLRAMQLRESIPQAAGGITGAGTYPGLLGGYTDQTSPALQFLAQTGQTGQTGTGAQIGGSPIFSRYNQARQSVNFSLAPFSQTASQNIFTPFLTSTGTNQGIL